jgi:hypothetical protein
MSGGVREITLDFESGKLNVGPKTICNLHITAPANIKYYLNSEYVSLNTLEYQQALHLVSSFYQKLSSIYSTTEPFK